jgi:hypothetical protein
LVKGGEDGRDPVKWIIGLDWEETTKPHKGGGGGGRPCQGRILGKGGRGMDGWFGLNNERGGEELTWKL